MNRRFLEQLKKASKQIKESVNTPKTQEHMQTLLKQKQYAEEQMRALKKQMKSMQSRMKQMQRETMKSLTQQQQDPQASHKPSELPKEEGWSEKLQKSWDEGVQSVKKSGKKIDERVSELKDSIRPPDLSEHISQAQQFAQQQRKKMQELGEAGKERLKGQAQRLEKLKQDGTEKLSELTDGVTKGVKKKAEFANELLKKMFWRTTLLIVLACFAYGIGSNLPRQLRLHFSGQEGEEKKKPKSFRKDEVNPNQ